MNYQLNNKAFYKLNSFYLVIGNDWMIQESGPAIQKLCGGKELRGALHDHFEVMKNPLVFSNEKYKLREETLYFLNCRTVDIRIKGQLIKIDDSAYLVACTPLIAGLKDISEVGLDLNDFPLQDYFTDAMFLLRANDKTMTELQEYSNTVKEQNIMLKEAQAELKKVNEGLEETVKERTSDLARSNEDLVNTLDHLQKTQAQLVESEKMAALGQLVGGIAHEINTPVGAIKAAVEQLSSSVTYNFENDPREYLSREEWKLFKQLLKEILSNENHFSPREARKMKKLLKEELHSKDWQKTQLIVGVMADLGYYGKLDRYRFLLQRDRVEDILDSLMHSVFMQRMSGVAMHSIDKADKVTSSLKNYIESEADADREDVDVAEFIREVLERYPNLLKGVNLEIEGMEETVMMEGIPGQLKLVFLNIIHNALQAMENEGTLGIELQREGDVINVHISDTGPGIPEEVSSRVFEPFFTTKTAGHGTGLGLNLVQKVVARHGGEIDFESKPGKTCFMVKLPVGSVIGEEVEEVLAQVI